MVCMQILTSSIFLLASAPKHLLYPFSPVLKEPAPIHSLLMHWLYLFSVCFSELITLVILISHLQMLVTFCSCSTISTRARIVENLRVNCQNVLVHLSKCLY